MSESPSSIAIQKIKEALYTDLDISVLEVNSVEQSKNGETFFVVNLTVSVNIAKEDGSSPPE